VTWKPVAETDTEVRHWMSRRAGKSRGRVRFRAANLHLEGAIAVERSLADPQHLRQVLTDIPAFAILEHLDRLKVADAIRRRPGASYVLLQDG
jgi:hypothetical protein